MWDTLYLLIQTILVSLGVSIFSSFVALRNDIKHHNMVVCGNHSENNAIEFSMW